MRCLHCEHLEQAVRDLAAELRATQDELEIVRRELGSTLAEDTLDLMFGDYPSDR
jgi:hypothetical protein